MMYHRLKSWFKAPRVIQVSSVKGDQAGFTLLEILLVIGVLSAMTVFFVELSNNYVEQQKKDRMAYQLRVVHAATEAYIRDNFADVEAAVAAGAGSTTISMADLKTSGIYLPTSYPEQTINQQPYVIMVRSPAADLIEALVVTSVRPRPLEEMLDVAKAAGAQAGLITGSVIGAFQPNTFVGAYSTWSRTVANYGAVGAAWQALDATPMANDEAHLAAIVEVDGSTVLQNYLFRVDVDASTDDENRMFTDLNMGNNGFDNLNAAVVDFVNVGGDVNVNAPVMTVTDGMRIENGNLIANGDMTVDGTLDVSAILTAGNVNVGNDTTATVIQGGGTAILDVQDTGISTSLTGTTILSTTTSFNNGTIQASGGSSTINVTDLDLNVAADVGGLGVTQMSSGNVVTTGGVVARQAVNLDGGTINLGTPVLTDFAGARGQSESFPPVPSAVGLDVVIGTRTNCATSTDGVCN